MPTPGDTPSVLLCLGSINADFQVQVARPLGPETMPASRFTRLSGGKAANRAFLARRLDVAAHLYGRVGDDELSEQALGPLRRAGADLLGVSVARDCSTAVSVIAVPPDGKKSILLAANANDAWDDQAAQDMADRLGTAPPGSVLSVDYEIPAHVVRRAAEMARQRGFALVIDPSWPDRVERCVLAGALAIAPNADEAEALTGTKVTDPVSAITAARSLAAQGPEIAAVKLADGGCVLVTSGRTTHIPAQPVEVVDTTGAGDAFTGALAVALLEGRTGCDAALFAVAASHAAVTAWGSQPAYPARDDIEARIPALARNMRDCGT